MKLAVLFGYQLGADLAIERTKVMARPDEIIRPD